MPIRAASSELRIAVRKERPAARPQRERPRRETAPDSNSPQASTSAPRSGEERSP